MNRKRLIGALDQGTTSTRFIIFDHDGNLKGSHQLEHHQMYPQAGWVEHDPLEIWQRACDCIRGALIAADCRGSDLAAIGITNQRETTVVWDPVTGKPWYNAVVWQDTRTDELCQKLATESPVADRAGLAAGQQRFQNLTGLPLATYFSGPKLAWLLEHVKGLREATLKGRAIAGTIDSWLVWWLTGGPHGGRHVTDVTNASRTMLMNLSNLEWDPLMLEVFDIPAKLLPRIEASIDAHAFGETLESGPLGAVVPICACLGDQQAALFGQTCFKPGEAKNTYGTGCFLLMNTGEQSVRSANGLLSTVAYQIAGQPAIYALEGSVAMAGSLVQWTRDQLGLVGDAYEISALAATVADSAGIYFVPAFSGLFAPYWHSNARGLIIGLTHFATRAHLARAVLEATAYQSREIFEAMGKDSGISLRSLKVDGGMVASEVLMQFQADILGVAVRSPRLMAEGTCLGAAYAAGLACGFWQDLDELSHKWHPGTGWNPHMDETERAAKYRDWQRAVQRSMDWA